MTVRVDHKQILYIIGASGLLGKAINNHFLHPNWNVIAGRARAEGNLSEIKNELAVLRIKNPESRITIINCAWSPQPTGMNRLDPGNQIWVQITSELVEHCLEKKYSYYGIGTCLERDLTIQDPYTSAKRECAEIVLTALSATLAKKTPTENERLSIGWLRPYYIYSLNPPTPSLIRFVVNQLFILNSTKETHNSVQIETNNSHDYIELEECVDLIQRIILSRNSGVFDLGTGKLESNASLIERLFPGVSVTTTGHESSIAGTSLTAKMEWKS
jgi:hypothetical protein